MPRLHFVKKARKANKDHDIKKGDSYYWWKFRLGRSSMKRISKTRPRRSQLTLSEFYGTMYDAEDDLEAAVDEFRHGHDLEALASACEAAKSDVEQAGETCQEKFDNMPDSLQQGETGQLLEGRVQSCEEIAQALDDAAEEVRSYELPEDDSKELDGEIQEVCGIVTGVDWSYE